MTRKFNFVVIQTALFLLPGIVRAQDSTVVNDFELWTGVSVKKSFLENKLSTQLTQEFRFDDNATRLDAFFTELGAKYKLENGLSFGAAYRFIRNNKNSGNVSGQRFNFDLGYRYKLDRLTLSSRFRYQRRNEFGGTLTEGDYPVTKYRLKLKTAYNIKNWKLDPYLAAEIFYAQQDHTINYVEGIIGSTERVSGFEKLRFTLGTSYKITDFMSVGAFYRIEREFKTYRLNYNTPATYYIGGINLNFKL